MTPVAGRATPGATRPTTTADATADATAIADRVGAVRARIADACARAGRDPTTVTLVAVTKTAAPAAVAAAVAAGVTDCGENRVADAEARIAAVDALLAARGLPRPRWRLIGHLQSNKARRAVACFDHIDSLDSIALADRLDALAAAAGRTLPVLLEVDLAGTPGRTGFDPEGLPSAAGHIVALGHLRVDGLMAVAPLSDAPDAARRAFDAVAALRDGLAARYPSRPWSVLSMGMTDDLEAAVAAGSTQVRVGRALFHPEG